MAANDHLNGQQFMDLYHATDADSAKAIMDEKKWRGSSHAFGSTVPSSGFLDQFGSARVHLHVPTKIAEPDPMTENDRKGWGGYAEGEQHYAVAASRLKPEYFVGAML